MAMDGGALGSGLFLSAILVALFLSSCCIIKLLSTAFYGKIGQWKAYPKLKRYIECML